MMFVPILLIQISPTLDEQHHGFLPAPSNPLAESLDIACTARITIQQLRYFR